MNALAELLAECEARGIRLLPMGDRLTIDSSRDALTPGLIDRLRAQKAELLATLRDETDTPGIDPTAVWQTALQPLEGNAPFAAELTAASRSADVCWDQTTTEAADDELGPIDHDGWPLDSIDADELNPCPKCGTLQLWETLAGNWRCQRCDPPTTAKRLREGAQQARRQCWTKRPVWGRLAPWQRGKPKS